LHANEIISPKPGDTILIIGGGPMGLIHLQISKLSGANVIVSEVVENRLKVVKEFGADITINPLEEDMPKVVKELTDGYGADAVIVATGNKTAIESALKAVSAGGTVVLFGGTYPPVNVEIDPNVIHYGEVKVTGSYDHLPIHVEKALKLLHDKKIEVGKLVSHTLQLEQLKEGFELVKNGTALKVQIKF
jgi:L-iditol 2-dehydrogenase